MVNDSNLRSCAFVLVLKHPLPTMIRISELLARKAIKVTSLYFHVWQSEDASLVIHCDLAKDKIGYIGRHFEELQGVKTVDWMNARTRTKQF